MRAALIALSVGVVVAAIHLAPPAPAPIVAGVVLAAPTEIEAGRHLELTVEASAPDGTPLRAIFISSYRSIEVEGTVTGGRATVVAPPAITAVAGRLDVAVQVGWTWATTGVEVLPGAVGEPPVPLVGSRSVVAGDVDRSMVVVIPSDVHGNPVPGADIAVTARWPEGAVAVVPIRPSTTLEWGWIPARRVAGRVLVTAAARIPGLERSLRVVPGAVEALDFDVAEGPTRADGVSFFELVTSSLTDRFGNRVLDGTAVTVETISAAGIRGYQTAVTVNGVARAILEAPAEPGPFEIVASVGDASARRLVEFEPAIAIAIPPVTVEARTGPDLVRVGPVVGDLGQLVPDGTPVSVMPESASGPIVGHTRSGVALVSVEIADDDAITVEVGGSVFEVPVGDAS